MSCFFSNAVRNKEDWYDHDNYHRGQIYCLINLYSKPSFISQIS